MDEVTLKLISLVEERASIYKKPPKARNKEETDVLWKEISRELNFPEGDCRYRWSVLRNCYARALRQKRRKNTICKPWYLYDRMSFLKDYIRPYVSKNKFTIKGAPHQSSASSDEDCSIIESSSFLPLYQNETSHCSSSRHSSPIMFTTLDENQDQQFKIEEIPDDKSKNSTVSIHSSPAPPEEPNNYGFKIEHYQEPIIQINFNEYDNPPEATTNGCDEPALDKAEPTEVDEKQETLEEVPTLQNVDELPNNSNKLFLASLLPDLNKLSGKKQRIFKRKTIELLENLFDETDAN